MQTQEQYPAKKHYAQQPEPDDHPAVAAVAAERAAERQEKVPELDASSEEMNNRILALLRSMGEVATAA